MKPCTTCGSTEHRRHLRALNGYASKKLLAITSSTTVDCWTREEILRARGYIVSTST